jgi:hypothetical protein
MKPLFSFFILLQIYQYSAKAQTDTSAKSRPYDVKSARVVYKFSNGPQSGEKVVVFDNWGRSEKMLVTTVTDTAAMGQMISGIRSELEASSSPHMHMADSALQTLYNARFRAAQHRLKIRVPGQVYMIDLDQQTGYKSEFFAYTSESVPFKGEGIEVGKDTVLGKPCRVVEFQHAFRISYWGRIALKKTILNAPAEVIVEEYAIEVDENYQIKPDEFKVPDSIKIHSAN